VHYTQHLDCRGVIAAIHRQNFSLIPKGPQVGDDGDQSPTVEIKEFELKYLR
jgi:hypothetical protein